jgi:hypothetical protein
VSLNGLKHFVAIRRGLLVTNPACKVPLPNPHNERDRVLTEDEWGRLYEAAAPHLKPILLTAYHLDNGSVRLFNSRGIG